MIITRTPFRVSFFGGGTDLPCWYNDNKGAVLSTTIDKYSYITCRKLPPFFEHKHRIVYSKTELIKKISDINHPAVRETMKFLNIKTGLEIHHDGDLPARSGLGSSSSFTVGLLKTLYALKGKIVDKKKLAIEAIHIEQDLIKEDVGSQDQVAAAYGGLNKITFAGKHQIEVRPMTIGRGKIQDLENHLMLFFTGLQRYAVEIEKEKIRLLPDKKCELNSLCYMVEEACDILNADKPRLNDFGKLLDESWKLKKSLSGKVSNGVIDDIYNVAKKNGALGGKILGAGGGGFILFFTPPKKQERLKTALKKLLFAPFKFESLGSQIIYYGESGG